VLKPEMSKNMELFLPKLTRAEVPATHWALMQKPAEVNAIIVGSRHGLLFRVDSFCNKFALEVTGAQLVEV
jgi:hypothetical protein